MTTPVNADPAELAKFSELAHRWWDPESEFRPLHQINPLRLDWINGLAPLAGRQVLDIGCGGGILADAMARKGAQVTGIEQNPINTEGKGEALPVADNRTAEGRAKNRRVEIEVVGTRPNR
jgi:ubiquinone biosynthesis O-methyltransferase